MSSSYMDIDDFMEVLDQTTDPCDKLINTRPNYDMLLQSLASLGKMIDKGESPLEIAKAEANHQDLTADLFCNMSDSEMLNHFIPIKGIDYEGYPTEDELKKDGKKGDAEIMKIMPAADDFMPYKMMSHLNPVYKLSTALQNNTEIIEEHAQCSDEEESDDNSCDDINDKQPQPRKRKSTEQQVDELVGEKKQKRALSKLEKVTDDDEPRQIKRRKPRTYKYNPKPLQHKISRAFVPDTLKDREYWERRKRNNEAAKKSREERRKKELEVMKSYEMMKQEYTQIKVENIRLKARNAVLEKQVAELKGKLKY